MAQIDRTHHPKLTSWVASANGHADFPIQNLPFGVKYVPIGYHGRASSILPSGVPVRRPTGQAKAPEAKAPTVAPSSRLDYELELGVWIGRGNALGEPISIAEAPEHIAGFCLLNDWSARDIQA